MMLKILVPILSVTLYLFYRWVLPRPLPGIPYNKAASTSILGDVPELMKYVGSTQELYSWLTAQCVKHQSPIVQVFARPFQKPWVVLADFQESQDIILRRTPKEFDRSDFFIDVYTGLAPDNQLPMKTNDNFKANRQLMSNLMTPSFLDQVAAPLIYSSFSELIRLWQEKIRLAQGRIFSVSTDVYNSALDAAWATMFGLEENTNATLPQIELCSSLERPRASQSSESPVEFPAAPYPAIFEAVIELTETIETSLKAPTPRLAHWLIRQTSSYKTANALKNKVLNENINKVVTSLENGKSEPDIRRGLEDVLLRVKKAADKAGRQPDFHAKNIYDEAFGFIVAAHDTTSTTVCWAVKILADHPEQQSKLRLALRSAFPEAATEQRHPTAKEITKSTIPYLDASQEELIRCSLTEAGLQRTAEVDTQLLGRHIPKGTTVFMVGNGPSFFSPAFEIDDKLRSQSALGSKDKIGAWDPRDMKEFKPERWLIEQAGEQVFNPNAGPHLLFGGGARGCYGKRMAYMELRIVLTLIVWNFELQPCPPEWNSYAAIEGLSRRPRQCYVRLAKPSE